MAASTSIALISCCFRRGNLFVELRPPSLLRSCDRRVIMREIVPGFPPSHNGMLLSKVFHWYRFLQLESGLLQMIDASVFQLQQPQSFSISSSNVVA